MEPVAARAAVARVATQAVGTAVTAEGEQTPVAAYGEQGTPVVPEQGVPGDGGVPAPEADVSHLVGAVFPQFFSIRSPRLYQVVDDHDQLVYTTSGRASILLAMQQADKPTRA